MERDGYETVLTYHESLAVKEAIRLAMRAERHRLQFHAAVNGEDFAMDSMLLKKLNTAVHIIERREERADDMGG